MKRRPELPTEVKWEICGKGQCNWIFSHCYSHLWSVGHTEMWANAREGKAHRKAFCCLWYQQWSEEISHIYLHSLGILFALKYTGIFLEWNSLNSKIPNYFFASDITNIIKVCEQFYSYVKTAVAWAAQRGKFQYSPVKFPDNSGFTPAVGPGCSFSSWDVKTTQ